MLRFREWLLHEDDMRALKNKKGGDRENYLDGMWRELGIDPNSVPKLSECGPFEIPEQGLWFNAAIWEVIKPIDLKDHFVRIKFHKSLSPNFNQRCYIKQENGDWMPFQEDLEGKIFLITIDKFAEILSKPWQSVAAQGGMGGPPGLGI